ncbi:MAG: AAA family ATPase [Planctomycetes bacterium]|nr:AAA family ATPase [Planctomycetota bacterium]
MVTPHVTISCGPIEYRNRRLVIVKLGDKIHRDRFDVDQQFSRSKWREAIISKLGLDDDAHEFLDAEVLRVADAEDELSEGELLADSKPVLVTMADVEARSINWLWPQRIAAGRLSLLVGRPGCGKSFLTCDMASRVSTGTPWPDGSPCPRGSVILICAEDDPADTVRPRLDAHRADVSRIHMLRAVKRTDDQGREIEVMFSLADIDALEVALKQCKDCRLVVVDPIGSFLGGKTDAHRDNEVRSVLAPVAALAEKYEVAVLVVCHTRKGSSTSADDTTMGSRAFTGIARSVWHLSCDGDTQSRRLLLPGKSNIAPEQGGLAFSIGGEPAAVHWERDPVKMTADDALAQQQGEDGQGSALDEAERWLGEKLRQGPQTGKTVKDAARQDGIAFRTIERAKVKLGVIAGPDGFRGPWVWQLPESANQGPDFAESAKEKTLADSDDTGAMLADSGEKLACTRCGGTEFQDTPAGDGNTIRRDCAGCGRTDSFPVWDGKAT